MEHVLPSLKLNDHQKELLLKVQNAATPHLAKTETEQGEKAIAATDILADLGAIELTDDGAEITEVGTNMLQDEGLVDDMGELTATAKEIIGGEETGGMEPFDIEPEGDMDDMFSDEGDGEFDVNDDEETPDEGEDFMLNLERYDIEGNWTLISEIDDRLRLDDLIDD